MEKINSKLYHCFVLLNVQGSLVNDVLLRVRVRVLGFTLRERFRRRPLLARLLGGECHGNLQDVGPAASSRSFRVYLLKEKYSLWLEKTLSDEVLKYIVIAFPPKKKKKNPHHGLQLSVDHILLKPDARILL